MSKTAELIELISRNKGAKFGSFVYRNEHGEVARVTLILGASTETLYKKDIEVLQGMLPDLQGVEKICAQELLDSRTESLAVGIGHNSAYTLEDVYVYPVGLEEKGIKVHKENGSILVRGLAQGKVVLQAGIYPPDRRRPKTVIKDGIRAQLPSHKFRTYRIDRVGTAKMNGEVLEIENLLD